MVSLYGLAVVFDECESTAGNCSFRTSSFHGAESPEPAEVPGVGRRNLNLESVDASVEADDYDSLVEVMGQRFKPKGQEEIYKAEF